VASRLWLSAVALLCCLCQNAFSQVIVTNYTTFSAALAGGNVITNFESNSAISLTNSSQTLEITTKVFIDAGSNNIVIDGESVARTFHLHPNCQLTINNLQLLNGASSTRGSAIYNEGTLIMRNCIISVNAAHKSQRHGRFDQYLRRQRRRRRDFQHRSALRLLF
jgi:hypothetical protein